MDAVGQAILSGVVAKHSAAEMVEETVRQHARFVYRLAYSILRDHHKAEDVAQETFLRVWQHGKQLAKVQDQQAWLARIAWRVISRHWKKHRRETPIDDPALSIELSALEIGAEQRFGDQQERALLDRMVAALPADLREVLLLSTVEEMSSFQIAEMLRVPESTVRGRLLRARKILRQKVERVIEGTK